MPRSLTLIAFAASTALSTPAFADLEPAEVWEDFKTYMESFGYEVSTNLSGGGDALTAADTVMTIALPEDEGMSGTVTMEFGDMTFTAEGDGVAVGFADVMPIRFDVVAEGEASQGVIEYRHDGLEMLVNGTADALSYTYTANAVTLELTELNVAGESIGRDAARVDMTLSNVSGQTDVTVSGQRDIDQTMAAGGLELDVFLSDPDGADDLVQITLAQSDLTLNSASVLPARMDTTDMAAMMAAGFATDTKMTFGSGETTMNVTEGGEIAAGASTSESGEFSIAISDTAIGYGLTNSGVNFQMAGGDLPFPVALKAAELGVSFLAPIAKTETAEDFAMTFTFADFEMSDMIWNMFDPGKALPRDPATLALDLSGKAKVLFDMFDPTSAAEMENAEMPAELETLSLNNLTLDLAGALLTGTGAFTFDNTDLDTFDGFPRPEGQVTLNLDGANGLIDTLVGMGLLPEEQAMGARMMMAMFAQPVGDDKLESVLEINSSGHVLANGQRLQ
ncbi:DUF2125 domain-containing protein [Roseobacteraceae bacterium S113]